MGTRSQVHFIQSGVYLYQHWDGSLLPSRVQSAISLNDRWDDEEYLTRIVFDSMKTKTAQKTTGYGIGTTRHGDIEFLVEIDCIRQTVKVSSGFGDDMDMIWTGTFEEFARSNQGDY